MAFELILGSISRKATGDMSSNQYQCVLASSSDAAGEIAVVAVRGGHVTGVVQDKSTAAGLASKVAISGVSKVAAGDSSGMENAITEGAFVMASSLGQAVPTTAATLHIFGMALEPLATGTTGIISILLSVPSRQST